MRGRVLVLVVLWLFVAGSTAWRSLERREDPPITSGVAVVVTPWTGASPEQVESLVTRELELELARVAGIDAVTSRSSRGVSVVVVQLDVRSLGRDVAPAMAQVRAAIDVAARRLPRGAGPPQIDEERFGAYSAIVALVPERPLPPAVSARLGASLADRLRHLPGTSAVATFGLPREEIRVRADPARLAALGLEPRAVARAIDAAAAHAAAGTVRDDAGALAVRLVTDDSLARLRDVVLRTTDAGTLRVGDVATLTRTAHEPAPDRAIVDGRQGLVIAARLGHGRDIDVWTDAVEGELDRFAASAPAGLVVEPVFLQRPYVERRLSTLLQSLSVGFLLVIGVLGAFLGRASLAAALSLPLVLGASLVAMRLLQVPLDQVSVAGLIVALGMVVDNAIVVVDHVRRARHHGATALEAARGARRQLWIPLGASTLTTMLAFLPIVLLGGRTGEFVGSLGVAVIVAIGASYAIALTVTAALAGRWHRAPAGPSRARWGRPLLGAALRRPRLAMALALAPAACGLALAHGLPKAFFPPAERPQLVIDLWLPPGTSLAHTEKVARRLEVALREDDEVRRVDWILGRSAPPVFYNLLQTRDGSPHFGQAIVQTRSVAGVLPLARRLQTRLDRVAPEAQVIVRPLEQGPPVEAALEVRVRGPELAALGRVGLALRERMARVSTVAHTRDEAAAGAPTVALHPDPGAVSRAGLALGDVARQLDDGLHGVVATRFLDGPVALPVRVDATGPWTATALARPGRAPTPLAALVREELVPGAGAIAHRDGERVNTVRGYLVPGASAAAAKAELDAILESDPVALPPGTTLSVGGEHEKSTRSRGDLLASVPALLLAMFAVMVLALRSFRLAAIVSVVALAAVGFGLLGLRLAGLELGFPSLLGLTAVMGIAVNDAIVVATALRNDAEVRAGSADAVGRVVRGETARHVLATTATTVAGLLPLLVAGGPFWTPFAVAVTTGVTLATGVAFFFVPPAVLTWARSDVRPR